MKTFTDPEFGEITVSYKASARMMRISVGTDGRLKASAPNYTPLFAVKAMVAAQRDQIRSLYTAQNTPQSYQHGDIIGKSHHLVIVPIGTSKKADSRIQGQNIIIHVPTNTPVSSPHVQRVIRDAAIQALRIEAKAYLPRRLKELAKNNGYTYERVRFSHAGTRWGSCSSTGTISLNIALMKLPNELIDYVLSHELAHTRHMNHSAAFWREVSTTDPHYKLHRRQMKAYSPTV